MVLDGRNRLLACEEAGVTPRFVKYEGNDPAGFVHSKNHTRRHLTLEERMNDVRDRLKAEPEKSNRQVAEETKTRPETVQKEREKLEGKGEIPKTKTRTSADGKVKKVKPSIELNRTIDDQNDDSKNNEESPEIVEKTSDSTSTNATVPIDDFDLPIPESLRELFAFAEEKFGEANTLIRKLEAVVDEIAKHDAGLFFKRNLQPNHVNGKDSFRFTPLRDLKAWLKLERPVMAICPYCHNTKPSGKPDPKCNGCKGKGFATASILKSCPQDYVDAAKEHLNGGDA